MFVEAELQTAIAEASELADLDAVAVPMLKRALGADHVAVLDVDARGRPSGVAGDLRECDPVTYFTTFFADDPVISVSRGIREPIALPRSHIDDSVFRRSVAYNEYYAPRRLDTIIIARLGTSSVFSPNSFCLAAFRAPAQHGFSEVDRRTLAPLLPALAAATRRHRRHVELRQTAELLERWLGERDPTARFLIDRGGQIRWASRRAESLLDQPGYRTHLVAAARELLLGGAPRVSTVFAADVTTELHLERDDRGELRVIAEVHGERLPTARLAELALAHGLTRAEVRILELLAQGLSNDAIAAVQHVSMATVKTHVHRLLRKLDVESRLQAALLVNEP